MIIATVWVSGAVVSSADTIYFDDATRGPDNTLQVGPVTITGFGYYGSNGSPMTVLGSGLGSGGGVGPSNELNCDLHYSVGQSFFDSANVESQLNLSVNGTINSITFLPQFRIFSATGAQLPDQLGYEMSVQFSGVPGPGYVGIGIANEGKPMTIHPSYPYPDGDSGVTFDWSTDFGFGSLFYDYRQQHLQEEQTIEMGVTILSMDYTLVPEPGVSGLLCVGLGMCGLAARLRRRAH